MNNFDLILKGSRFCPTLNNEIITPVLTINMKENYKEIFGIDMSFEEFIKELKNNKSFKEEILSILKDYYGINNLSIITNSSYDNWYFVNKDHLTERTYNLNYVIKVGTLNTESIMDDYIDLFNNKIIYKNIA